MTRAIGAALTAFIIVASCAARANAQTTAESSQGASSIRVGARVGESPTRYDDGGRRDPFVSLIVPKTTPTTRPAAAPARPVAGLVGVSITDVVVKGLIKSGDSLIALLLAPDGHTYMARKQDRLLDGVIARIESDGVVFTERSADAAGVVRAHDVRKPLRAAVSGGQ